MSTFSVNSDADSEASTVYHSCRSGREGSGGRGGGSGGATSSDDQVVLTHTDLVLNLAGFLFCFGRYCVLVLRDVLRTCIRT